MPLFHLHRLALHSLLSWDWHSQLAYHTIQKPSIKSKTNKHHATQPFILLVLYKQLWDAKSIETKSITTQTFHIITFLFKKRKNDTAISGLKLLCYNSQMVKKKPIENKSSIVLTLEVLHMLLIRPDLTYKGQYLNFNRLLVDFFFFAGGKQ